MLPLTNTKVIQADIADWNDKQPWADDEPQVVVLGVAEEVGELCRASLKDFQGIRGTHEEWLAEVRKETGDIFIKLCAVADAYGFDLDQAITDRWVEVRERNFTRDPLGHGIDKS